uniref:Uncharacterized protein n=1 Tax=Fundulus heteroclitus TaxID=8078 RepID=A0A3Q2QZN8_FUNHE
CSVCLHLCGVEICKYSHSGSPAMLCLLLLLLLTRMSVLCQKKTDSPELKQVSVRRFATYDLFRRKKLSAQEHRGTSDDQWVEYRSVFYPEYSAFLSLKVLPPLSMAPPQPLSRYCVCYTSVHVREQYVVS